MARHLLILLAVFSVLCTCVVGTAVAQPRDAPDIEEWPELSPRVIDCSPKPFETNVPADLKELSVTSDRPNNTTGHSTFESVPHAEAFPGKQGALAEWDETSTTCTLAVDLAPHVTGTSP